MNHVITFHIEEGNEIEHIVEANSTEEAIFNIMNRKEKYYVFESDSEIYYLNLDHVKYINGYETDEDTPQDRVIF